MIQDSDENILSRHDRLVQLDERLKVAIQHWIAEDIAKKEDFVVTSRQFIITPINENIDRGLSTVMRVIVDRSNGWIAAHDMVFKALSPYTDKYEVTFT